MLATIRSAVSRRRARLATHRRRAAAYRTLAGEPLEGRLLLSADSWVLPIGMPSNQVGPLSHHQVATDSAGNVFVATTTDGGTDNRQDIFLAKYSRAGEEIWRHYSPVPDQVRCYGAALSNEGFYVTGALVGSFDFDFSEGEAILQSVEQSGFLAKYSPDGAFQWVRHFSEWGVTSQVVVQQNGVYVTGQTRSEDMPGFTSTVTRAMVVKLNCDNDLLWAEDIGSGVAWGLAVYKPAEGLTQVYVAGSGGSDSRSPLPTRYVAQMLESGDESGASIAWITDPGEEFGYMGRSIAVGVDEITSDENNVVLEPRVYVISDQYGGQLLKIDQSGHILWHQRVASEWSSFTNVAVDGQIVYLVGNFRGSASFDENSFKDLFSSRGDTDSYLVRYRTDNGQPIAAQRMGGIGKDSLVGLAVADGYILATGYASPGAADFPIGQRGQDSAFVSVMPYELYVMQLDASAPIVTVSEASIWVQANEPVILAATASAGTTSWYESGTLLGTGHQIEITRGLGTYLITAIATDEGRIGMGGVAVFVGETYASTDTPKPMADAHPSKGAGLTTSQITVADGTAITAIETLKVDLSIAHSAPKELQAVLVGPDGTQVTLFHRPSSLETTYATTAFVGKSLAGTWTLRLYDHVRYTVGTLNSWSIAASPQDTEPHDPPIAAVGGSYSGVEDIAVTFDASGSSAPDGSIVTYTWDFGDGSAPVSTGEAIVSHTYLWGATFNVTLTVKDDRGATATATTTAEIAEVNDAPIADIGGPYSGVVDRAISFDGSRSSDFDNEDGTPVNDQSLSYTWDFGDGSDNAFGAIVEHTYAAAGAYTVTLTVTDGALQSTATVSIEVHAASVGTPLYVYDIRFESTRANKDWRAVFEIRSDSNGSGGPDAGDAPLAGVAITVTFAGQTYSGTTDADGLFRTGWIKNLASGTHYANVVDLAMASYFWDALSMDLEDDSDGDGKPDNVLYR